MTLPASIRVNVRVPFPSRVQGAAFVTVSKANGVWTIAPNYQVLADFPTLTATQVVAAYDLATGTFGLLTAAAITGAGNYRNITGSTAVLGTDNTILANNTTNAGISVNLPQSSARNGVPITVKDIGGNANEYPITFVPYGTETIDGFSPAAAVANGVALIDSNYAKKSLYPLSSGGWYIL